MKFTTRKTEQEGVSQICVDGAPTDFYIERGDDPAWGDHREWHVYHGPGDGPVMTIYRRKSDALEAFQLIYEAGVARGASQ